jgi:uncharacterized protein (TIGR04255 family)
MTQIRAEAMPYKRAPVTEAVIEARFLQPLAPEIAEGAAQKLRGEHQFEDPDKGFTLEFNVTTNTTEVHQVWSGVKLSSSDRTDVSIFRTNSFACSRLAPYLGWECFQPRAQRDWGVFRKTSGPVELARIGLRYINRVDIPASSGVPIRVEDYLNVSPKLPETGEAIFNYTMQVVQPIGADDCGLILNSASVPSPLIGFASFVLDIDVFREKDLPRRDKELWALIERMRHHKNSIFESCITDQARTLFDQ